MADAQQVRYVVDEVGLHQEPLKQGNAFNNEQGGEEALEQPALLRAQQDGGNKKCLKGPVGDEEIDDHRACYRVIGASFFQPIV